jgi:hypothetical protein
MSMQRFLAREPFTFSGGPMDCVGVRTFALM